MDVNKPQRTQHPPAVTSAEDIERVFLRLINADNHIKLQMITDRYLVDMIAYGAEHPEHLNLVTEFLTQYNKVVKSNHMVFLPSNRLLDLFEFGGPVAMNLSLVYLKYARDRVGSHEIVKILPVFLRHIGRKPNDLNYIYDLMGLCMPAFHQLAFMETKNWPKIEINSAGVEVLARAFQAILMFSARTVDEIKYAIERIPGMNPKPKLPGISLEEYIQIGKKLFPEHLNLSDTKCTILKILGKELLEEKVAFPLIVVGSASRLNEVDSIAEGLLKKLPTETLVNDKYVVDKLMGAYLGSEAGTTKVTDPLKIIDYGNQFVQEAVLGYLGKSKVAPVTFMNNIKICMNGCTSGSGKVQTLVMNFFALVVEQMPASALKPFSGLMFKKLNDVIRVISLTNVALCGVYKCLSILGTRQPSLIIDDSKYVVKLFRDLENENVEDVAGSIGSCLSSWLPVIMESNKDDLKAALRVAIQEHITSERPSCRLVSLKYAEALIGEDDMDLRWMLLQASGDPRDPIRSEAFRQLEKSLQKGVPPAPLVIGFLWSSLQKDFRRSGPEPTETLFNSIVHQNSARYLYALFETIVMNQPAHLRIVEGDDHWMSVTPRIVRMMHVMNNTDMLEKAAEMTLYAMTDSNDVHLVRIASCFLAAFQASVRERQETRDVKNRFQFAIQPCVTKLRDSVRMEFSNALSYLLTALLDEDQAARDELFRVSHSEFSQKEIPGLAWICAAAITPVLGSKVGSPMAAHELIKNVFLPFIKNGYDRPSPALESVIGTTGFILQNNLTALDQTAHKDLIDELIAICEKIAVSRKEFTQKSKENSAKVVGLVSGLVESSVNDSSYKDVVQSLVRFGEGPPQQELQLIVGEAIVDGILGNHALSKRDFYLLDGDTVSLAERIGSDTRLALVNQRIVDFINESLTDKKENRNQHFRRAQLVWMLIVMQSFAKWKADVLKNAELLKAVQEAFSDGLTENDEFSQDVSSKGMGVVYGLADGDLKKQLVDLLMTTLTEGKRSETKVTGDTKLFESGQLGQTPTGGKLTTYQELLTLASDLNQPDLVYKFMQLARHNATWNSKLGAAHGFGALLENAKEEIEPYFNQLVPKLFRLRYDPDTKVQAAMRSIWAILTSDRKNVVDEFANEIAKELLPAVTDREFRVRESACLALSDILRGHDTPEMHKLIPTMLESVLRVRDDVKESTREAANRAADALSKLIVRLGSSGNLEKANAFLAIALPAVIDQGILKSTVKGNTLFCLKLVLELTKVAGKQLKPYIADLVPLLMDAISENETPLLNYLAVRSTQEQMEALDDARASFARSSPMMTAINDLLPHIDGTVLVDMTPKLVETLRSSVGVSTRSSAAQFVTQLALRAPQLMIDHTAQCDKLLAGLTPGIRDRNPSIRKQFANTLSYLAKFVSQNQMKKLIKVVVADLLTNDEDLKNSACHVISNLASNSAEMLSGYTSQIVPYVMLERCREVPKGDEIARQKQEAWNEVWAELVPSTSSAVRLYKNEILTLATDLITNSEVWAVRKQAAVMVGEVFEQLKQDAGFETSKNAALCLLENLNGRIWDGKAEILNALSKTFVAGGSTFKASLQPNEVASIVSVIKREASKKNAEYACSGLSTVAAWSVVTSDMESADWLADKVSENVKKLISERSGEDSDDQMDGLSNLEKEIRVSKLVTLNLTALALALPTFKTAADAKKSLDLVSEYVKNPAIAWKSKQFLFVELAKSVEKWKPDEPVNCVQLVDDILDQADELVAQQKKTVAADALQVILRMQETPRKFGLNWSSVAEKAAGGIAGQSTGLANRFEVKMETD